MTTFIISIALILVLILTLAFPLYFYPVLSYRLKHQKQESHSYEQDALLNALEELEEEYQLGRIEEKDYQQLKNYTQRRYLKAKQKS